MNWVLDCPDWPIISETSPFLSIMYPLSIEHCLQQGCCHRECLDFSPVDNYPNLPEFNTFSGCTNLINPEYQRILKLAFPNIC